MRCLASAGELRRDTNHIKDAAARKRPEAGLKVTFSTQTFFMRQHGTKN